MSKLGMRKLREHRIFAGLCVKCGNVPAREGKRMCQGCADNVNEYSSILRTALSESNRCCRCNKSKDRVGAYCCSCVKIISRNCAKYEKRRH